MSDQISFEDLVKHYENNNSVAEAKWFGKQCISVNGKAFAVFFGGDVAFKLDTEDLAASLEIPGAKLFDPRGKGSPFKEWAQISANNSEEWKNFSEKALAYVDSLKK